MKRVSFGFAIAGALLFGCSDAEDTSNTGATQGAGGPTTAGTAAGGTGMTTGAGAAGGAGGTGGTAATGGTGGAPDVLGDLTEGETVLARSMSPLPALPASPTNKWADNAGAATLGQKFYFESDWAGPLAMDSHLGTTGEVGKVSCRSCHDSETFDRPDNVAIGANFHPRHAPGSVNAAYYDWPTWRGRFDSLWALPRAVFEAGAIFASTRLRVAHVVYDQYQTEYDAVFTDAPLDARLDPGDANAADFPATGKPGDSDWDNMVAADKEVINVIVANVGKALEAYQRLLIMQDSPFDRFVAETDTLRASEQRGFQLFVGKANCVACHSGAFFSDNTFRNLGLEQTGPNVPANDDGRFNVIDAIGADAFNVVGAYSDDVVAGQLKLDNLEPKTDDLKGRFRVASVRNVGLNAPFMHAGQISNLDELVEFYNAGGGNGVTGTKDALVVPLNLTIAERDDLVAFLEALTGEPLPAALSEDTSN